MAVFPGVVSNHHLHAMAALGVTLAEFLAFGRDYAAQIVRNAKALAQALHERGIKVLAEKHGFTESHALALDVAAFGGGAKVATDLEKAHIITNKNLLPWDTSPVRPSGIRLGTQELTRRELGIWVEVVLVHQAERRDVPRDGTDRAGPCVECGERLLPRVVGDREDPFRTVVVGLFEQVPQGRGAHDVPEDRVDRHGARALRVLDEHDFLSELRALPV